MHNVPKGIRTNWNANSRFQGLNWDRRTYYTTSAFVLYLISSKCVQKLLKYNNTKTCKYKHEVKTIPWTLCLKNPRRDDIA